MSFLQDEPKEQKEKMAPTSSKDSIKHLSFQISKMPELTKQARLVDQILLDRFQDLKFTASTIIDQFREQRKIILQHFDSWIMPIARDVLDELIIDAQKLKHNLDVKLECVDQTTAEEWSIEAKSWQQLYSKWSDRKGLIDKILEIVANRTEHLIDKDIQVIQDYQRHSLSHLSHETEAFKHMEERLASAIEEPLKQLMNLREQAKEHKSIQQASEWVSKLQEQRESYFNQLLMKIDHVMKDVVNLEENKDWTAFAEFESEILFMENELRHIQFDLERLHLVSEKDKQFLLARLEGLSDHIQDLNKHSLPLLLQNRIQALKSDIFFTISCLEEKRPPLY